MRVWRLSYDDQWREQEVLKETERYVFVRAALGAKTRRLDRVALEQDGETWSEHGAYFTDEAKARLSAKWERD